MNNSNSLNSSQIKSLVSELKKNRQNRVYAKRCFEIENVQDSGLLPLKENSVYDQVVIQKSLNEQLDFIGFDKSGSCFELFLNISSLYPSTIEEDESKWRLASVNFSYYDSKNRCKYNYNYQELIDYDVKRNESESYDTNRVYKIGSLIVEIVNPFSLVRILFNGILMRSLNEVEDLVSIKMAISTHPTSDKFDYKNRFSSKYLTKVLHECQINDTKDAKEIIDSILEDRIDQTMLFQGQLEYLDKNSNEELNLRFILWGVKIKKFFDIRKFIEEKSNKSSETLIVWVECGHIIVMNRYTNCLNSVYGLIHSCYDYSSYFYDAKLLKKKNDDLFEEVRFDELKSFSQLTTDYQIQLIGYKQKLYTLDIINEHSKLKEVKVNDFEGLMLITEDDFVQKSHSIQSLLWTMRIDENGDSKVLSSESLLGGKGHSLIQLNEMIRTNMINRDLLVSVPKGLVVSSAAYKIWFDSNPMISNSIKKLDFTRRSLAARSVYVNPMSDKHLTQVQSQQILKEQCKKTSLILNSCPLPLSLRKHLYGELRKIFSIEDLKDQDNENEQASNKLFAIRSSAVGEDSLETSAAGQMRTILDAKGFNQICNSIIDCWSSQFDLEAVTYKTQNGLPINLPMAVVVQELIQCEVAGVGATCDPLTGNKCQLEILANRGLGEGVVSGKETDTIRVFLKSLQWDQESEVYQGTLNINDVRDSVEIINSASNEICCLTNEQIISIAKLLLDLRRFSFIKDREIEWGITKIDEANTTEVSNLPSSSSSSSSSSFSHSNKNQAFRIHLLQSRPLTHLRRLNAREIDQEFDYGIGSPLDLVSRANLGEVMPGSASTINSTFFLPIVGSFGLRKKPFEKNHTKAAYSADTFSYHSQIAMMVLTHTDTLTRFETNRDSENEFTRATMEAMIGFSAGLGDKKRELLKREKMNPNSITKSINLATILIDDSKIVDLYTKSKLNRANNTKLHQGLTSIETYIEQTEKSNKVELDHIALKNDIDILYNRIIKSTEILQETWLYHSRSTLLSMAFNTICIKMISKQEKYSSGNVNFHEVLNDFSILIRNDDSDKTESGNISHLLKHFIKMAFEEGELDKLKSMNNRELYDYLMTSKNNCAKIFKEFMINNGHRAFKEFDFSTLTWADDPSYIIKSLSIQLKNFKESDIEKEAKQAEKIELELKDKAAEVLAGIDKGKFILTKFLLPRASNAVLRREKSKSALIKSVDIYRQAFRHLGGLLCLDGKIPSADLIFWLSCQELYLIIKDEYPREVLSKFIYKARRRQQRSRILDQIRFPKPTLKFENMVKFVDEIDKKKQSQLESELVDSDGDRPFVKGLTSCGGCVTGKARVVNSIEEMDQIEENEILITYSIDISWSVYFFIISGIVTEMGGIVSHGAVVAREYGIPTLCTALGACSKFKTGQLVTLNADLGICHIAENTNGID